MSIRKMTCPRCKLMYEVILEGRLQRSNQENRYFHGVVLPILSRHLGYTEDEVKDLVKAMFLKDEMFVQTKTGMKEVGIVKGSSELDTLQFEKFMESIRRWSAIELGCNIPEPNEEIKK